MSVTPHLLSRTHTSSSSDADADADGVVSGSHSPTFSVLATPPHSVVGGNSAAGGRHPSQNHHHHPRHGQVSSASSPSSPSARMAAKAKLARELKMDADELLAEGQLSAACHAYTEAIATAGLAPAPLLARGACYLAQGRLHAAQADASLALLTLNTQLDHYHRVHGLSPDPNRTQGKTLQSVDESKETKEAKPEHEHHLWHGLPADIGVHHHPDSYDVDGITGEHDHTNVAMDALDTTVRAFRLHARAMHRRGEVAGAAALYAVCITLIEPWESVKYDDGDGRRATAQPWDDGRTRTCESGLESWVWVEPLDFVERYSGVKSIHKQAEWMRTQLADCERRDKVRRAVHNVSTVWNFIREVNPHLQRLLHRSNNRQMLTNAGLGSPAVAINTPHASQAGVESDDADGDASGTPATPAGARRKRRSFIHSALERAEASPTSLQKRSGGAANMRTPASRAALAASATPSGTDSASVMKTLDHLHEDTAFIQLVETPSLVAMDISERYIRGNALQPKARGILGLASSAPTPMKHAQGDTKHPAISVDFHPEDLLANHHLCNAVWGYKQARDVEVESWMELPEWSGPREGETSIKMEHGSRIAQSRHGVIVPKSKAATSPMIRSRPHYNVGATVRPMTASPPETRSYAYQQRTFARGGRRAYAKDSGSDAIGERPNMYVHPWNNLGGKDSHTGRRSVAARGWNSATSTKGEFNITRTSMAMKSLVLASPRSEAIRVSEALRASSGSSLGLIAPPASSYDYSPYDDFGRSPRDLNPLERAFVEVDDGGQGTIPRRDLPRLDAALAKHGLKLQGDKRNAADYPATTPGNESVHFGDFALWWEESVRVERANASMAETLR